MNVISIIVYSSTGGGNTMKLKKFALGATALLAAFALSACGSKEKSADASGSDDTLSIWSQYPGLPENASSWKDSPFLVGLEKETGQKVEWEFPTQGSDPKQAFNLMLSEDKLPDMIWYGLNRDAESYINDGILQDLTKLLPEKAPNYWKFLKAHPEYDRAMKTDSGKYYGFGFFREDPVQTTYLGPMIRQDWLDEQNLKSPQTINEWEKALKVMNDEYDAKLSFLPGARMVPGFAGAFGAHGTFSIQFFLDENNQVKLAQAEPEWQDYMKWLHKLYEQKLIDPDVVTMADDNDLATKIANNKVSATVTASSQLTIFNENAKANGSKAQWVGVKHPNQADGSKTASIFTQGMINSQAAAITTACTGKDLDRALAWLDWNYSEEGYHYWNFGTEGETWEMKDDVPTFTDKITKSSEGTSMAVSRYTGNGGVGQGLQSMDATKQRFDEASVAAMTAWYDKNDDAFDAVVPMNLSLTPEESKEHTTLDDNIAAYVVENSVKFMTGEKKESEYDEFVQGIKDRGLDRFLEIKQTAYERYLNRK